MIAAIILAAGKGTRMKSRLPKVLHRVAGRPMVDRVVRAARDAGCERVVVVVGHGAEQVREVLPADAQVAHQAEQLGTAHAVLAARGQSPEEGALVILSGDVPLIRSETIRALVERHRSAGARLTLVSGVDDAPGDLGRIERDANGRIAAIVEARDATPEQLRIRETNRGIYCVDAAWLWSALPALPAAPSGEYYLTDAVRAAVDAGERVEVVSADASETTGINDRVQLAAAEAALRRRTLERLMQSGVTFVDPRSCYVDDDVWIDADTIVEPNSHLRGATRIGSGCRIGPNSIVVGSQIGNDCVVVASIVEDSIVEAGVDIGPFSHLRGGAFLGRGVHVGNFAEIKNSHIGADSKMGHFSYVGDAELGAGVNIGAGTVTCNFDGVQKHLTRIGAGAFIGSDSMLVAPVTIGRHAVTGAGAVVTRDVPDGALAVGVPARVRRPPPSGEGDQ